MAGFWTDNTFEPKQNHKFKVLFTIEGEQLMVPWYYVISCDKPSFEIGEAKYKLLNEEKKYPTNVTWKDITITFVETTDNVSLGILYGSMNLQQIRESVTICETRVNAIEKPSQFSQVTAGTFVIQTLDNEGEVIESWTLNNWWVKNIGQDTSDYGSENISKVKATISYDWAKLDIPNYVNVLTEQFVGGANRTSAPIDTSGLNRLTRSSFENRRLEPKPINTRNK